MRTRDGAQDLAVGSPCAPPHRRSLRHWALPFGGAALAPHRISLRHSARPLRLPLKGGVIPEFLEGRFAKLEEGDGRILGDAGVVPPTASVFATNLACANPRQRTRSRLWLALCEPPTAEAFAIGRCRLEAPRWPPHRIGLRHSARPLRLPLKGGVILEFLNDVLRDRRADARRQSIEKSYPPAVSWVTGEPRMRRLAWVAGDKVAYKPSL